MKSLYEINHELQSIIEVAFVEAEPNEGEIPESLSDQLDALEIERSQKIGDIARYIKNLVSEAAMVKAEEKSLSNRRKSCENKSARLKEYLASMMPGESYKDSNSVISWRKSEQTVISNELLIPDNYCTIIRKVSAADVKKAIKSGASIEGASIVEKQNIQIK